MCAIEMNDAESARRHFEAFVKVNGEDSDAWVLLASAAGAMGDFRRARFAVEQSLKFGADPARVEPLARSIEEARRAAENTSQS
jgi:Flp pilus assembly protein TadD